MGMVNGTLQRLQRQASTAALLVSLAALTACASVTLRPWGKSPLQAIEVVAVDLTGAERTDLRCRLHNEKGEWQVAVPGTVDVIRSSLPLKIACVTAEGVPSTHADVAATDERSARAKQQATRGGIVGAGLPLLFFGAIALSPGGLVYAIATGATFGGVAAAEQALADTVTDAGFGYPGRIELRF